MPAPLCIVPEIPGLSRQKLRIFLHLTFQQVHTLGQLLPDYSITWNTLIYWPLLQNLLSLKVLKGRFGYIRCMVGRQFLFLFWLNRYVGNFWKVVHHVLHTLVHRLFEKLKLLFIIHHPGNVKALLPSSVFCYRYHKFQGHKTAAELVFPIWEE